MFEEYSMTDPKNLGSYFEFTESEVKTECLIRDVDYAEMIGGGRCRIDPTTHLSPTEEF